MTGKTKILAMAGSLRKDSYNRKILQIAKSLAAELGAEIEEADLKELALPIYDGDIEAQGFPASVQKLHQTAAQANLYLIATPEYNFSVPAALKNALEWLSRGPKPMAGKVAAIFGASSGMGGTIRAQMQLRQILLDLNVIVAPSPNVFIRSAAEAFNPDGTFRDPPTRERLKTLIATAIQLSSKLRS